MKTGRLKLASKEKGWNRMIDAFQEHIDSEVKCFTEQLIADAGKFQANYEAENDICFHKKLKDCL